MTKPKLPALERASITLSSAAPKHNGSCSGPRVWWYRFRSCAATSVHLIAGDVPCKSLPFGSVVRFSSLRRAKSRAFEPRIATLFAGNTIHLLPLRYKQPFVAYTSLPRLRNDTFETLSLGRTTNFIAIFESHRRVENTRALVLVREAVHIPSRGRLRGVEIIPERKDERSSKHAARRVPLRIYPRSFVHRNPYRTIYYPLSRKICP